MQTETRRTPAGSVILASVVAALVAIAPAAIGTLVVGLAEAAAGTLQQSLETMLVWGYVVLAMLGASLLGSLIAFVVTAWKPRVPGAIFAGLGLLPVAAGLLGTLAGLRMGASVLGQVSLEDRPLISAASTSEAVLSTLFGGLLSALLLLGAALGLGLLALLSARRSTESRVSGAPALLCAGLALAVACLVLPWQPRRAAFEALHHVNPADRATILAAALEELQTLRLLTGVGAAVALALVVAAGVWALRHLQGAGRVARGLAAVVVVAPVLGLSVQMQGAVATMTREATVLPWEATARPREAPVEFLPVRVAEGSYEAREADVTVTPTQLVPREGAPAPLDQADAVFRAMFAPKGQGSAEGDASAGGAPSFEKKQQALKLLARMNLGGLAREEDAEAYIPGLPIELRLAPNAVLAVDARLTGAQLGAVLDAARAAGVRSVQFVGVHGSAERVRQAFAGDPLFGDYARAMTVGTSERMALVSAVPRGLPEADPVLWHARLEAPGPFTVRPRAGAPGEPRTLDPKATEGRGTTPEPEPSSLERTPVYLAIGSKDVKVQDVVLSAAEVTRVFLGRSVVLVTGELPGAPERSLRPPSEALDEGGGGGGSDTVGLGTAGGRGHGRGVVELAESGASLKAVKSVGLTGTLSKEDIKRVVHRHRGQMRYCYEAQLQRHPGLAGKAVVRFTIAASGDVESAEVSESTLGNEVLHQCLAQRVRSWKFPAFDGGEVSVAYPFTFTAATE
jgi:TonB family protein